ncbi:MAG: aldehyde-activating protein [Candidatus Nomurabacteria bacterium]|nr:aldehyde-activating protein [Candidatus Nomurabacteria bacterium]
MNTYKGACHCKAVTYEVDTNLEKVISCNCSHCYIKGLVLSFVSTDQFKLSSSEGNLTEYLFNKKKIHHLFCNICGVESFARGVGPNGEEMIAINVRCLDGVDLDQIEITKVDGKKY